MKQQGLYSLALVVAAGLLGFLFSPIVAEIGPSSAQPELTRSAPAFGSDAQQQPGETLAKLSEQQTRLTHDLAALEAKLTRLETRLNRLTLSAETDAETEMNQAEHHPPVKQMMSDLTARLDFLETELESERDDGFIDSDGIQAQATDQAEDIASLSITDSVALDGVFDTEPRDEAWAMRKEAELSQLLLSNERTQDGLLTDYECRYSICRLSMQFDSLEARNQSLETIPAILDFDGEVSALPTEGTTEVKIYVISF